MNRKSADQVDQPSCHLCVGGYNSKGETPNENVPNENYNGLSQIFVKHDYVVCGDFYTPPVSWPPCTFNSKDRYRKG